jgi:hypothetical protein
MASIYPSLARVGRQRGHPKWMISLEVYAMTIPRKEITIALACRTKGVLIAQKALFAAATIHMTTVVVLIAGLAVMLHTFSA